MKSKPYDTNRQLNATVSRLLNGDGYRRWTTQRPRYYLLLWDWIDVEHEEYVGKIEVKARDQEVADRQFQSEYRLRSFSMRGGHGFSLELSTGGTVNIAAGKVSIRFQSGKFDGDHMMPYVGIVWHARGKRHGPFEAVREEHVTLTFKNHKHMDHCFSGGAHLPHALRHHDRIYIKRDDAYYDNSGNMLPMWMMIWYVMSESDRQAFAAHNASLVSSMPDASMVQASTVDRGDDDFKAAISDDTGTSSPSAGASVDFDAGNQNDAGSPVNTDQGTVSGNIDTSVSMPDPGSMTSQ